MQPPYGYGPDPTAQLRQEIADLRNQIQQLGQHVNGGVGAARRLNEQADKKLADLAVVMQAINGSRSGGGGIVRIEDIPGKREPYTLLMDIPISNNTTTVVTQSVTIPQEGPFVACKRMATFQSALEFQVTSSTTVARFAGRSFGRYRPIHSAWDIFDAQSDSLVMTNNPMAVATTASTTGIVSSKSGFRTMEFDGRIETYDAGSGRPRQRISVPSSMWTPQINAPMELCALDFFERASVITINVTPTHVNNPPAGNTDGSVMPGGAASSYPFLAGQYDPHEGISSFNGTTNGFTVTGSAGSVTRITTDPIARLPDGLLTIGWEGYRILQPTGPVG